MTGYKRIIVTRCQLTHKVLISYPIFIGMF